MWGVRINIAFKREAMPHLWFEYIVESWRFHLRGKLGYARYVSCKSLVYKTAVVLNIWIQCLELLKMVLRDRK